MKMTLACAGCGEQWECTAHASFVEIFTELHGGHGPIQAYQSEWFERAVRAELGGVLAEADQIVGAA